MVSVQEIKSKHAQISWFYS